MLGCTSLSNLNALALNLAFFFKNAFLKHFNKNPLSIYHVNQHQQAKTMHYVILSNIYWLIFNKNQLRKKCIQCILPFKLGCCVSNVEAEKGPNSVRTMMFTRN